MTTTATYRIDELDAYGDIANSVGGLTAAEANAFISTLNRSAAHTDGRRTATMTRELTTAEIIDAAVADWRAGRGNRLTGRDQIAAALHALSVDIAMGDTPVGEVHVEVSFSIHGTAGTAAADSASATALAESMNLALAEASTSSPGVSFHVTPRELPVRVNAYVVAPVPPRPSRPTDAPAEASTATPDAWAQAQEIASELGATVPSLDLNRRIQQLPGFSQTIKYSRQRIVTFTVQGTKNHIAWNPTSKTWGVIER